MIELAGKKALINGADNDTGRAIALRLAERGMKLALAGRDAERLMQTAALTGRPLDMLVLPVELEKSRAIQDIMRIMTGHFKVLDLLVNCAWDVPDGTFMLCQKTLPLLRLSDCPTIINVGVAFTDQDARIGLNREVSERTRTLAKEVAPEGICVHMLAQEDIANQVISVMEHRGEIDVP